MLKIIAGEHRSRRLEAPEGDATRPMTARVKESVFGLLRGWFEGATVLDLFAGVGTVGLEALSRGAERVVMVERDREILGYLRRNVESLRCGDRATILPGDALAAATLEAARAASGGRSFDLVFCDPPYPTMREATGLRRVLSQLGRCRAVMGGKGFLVLRTPLDPDAVDHRVAGLDGPEVHRYSKEMAVLLYAPGADAG